MFDKHSRYAKLETSSLLTAKGETITFVKRRFLPPAAGHRLLVEVAVSEGDRLDLIASKTIGNAEQYWRICDANDAMDPFELLEQPGRVLSVPLPQI